jgi:hypothetical protein
MFPHQVWAFTVHMSFAVNVGIVISINAMSMWEHGPLQYFDINTIIKQS